VLGGGLVALAPLAPAPPPALLLLDDGAGPASYRIVECSSERRSNMRTLPSAPTDAKMSREAGDQATS